MQHVIRLTLTLLFVVTFGGSAFVQAATPKQVEYKRADQNVYLKADVLKADPTAIILPATSVVQNGDSYLFTPKKKAPKEIYLQVDNDWIEPITPPDLPVSLGVKPDEMQIRDPQGDVQVMLPNANGAFVAAQNLMVIPNGTVVKTGANSTAAVLFGGVDSARLTPDSSAAVQQTVDATSRSTEVDLHAGAVFSKVGKQVGVTQTYQVKTPFGVAAARGTDFVTVVLAARVDVWVAQGTVQLDAPDGKTVGTVQSEGTGTLKIIRYPVAANANDALTESAETMTIAMGFIPLANTQVKGLEDRLTKGDKLSVNETKYLSLIKHVPGLIKLALVEAAPAPASVVAPVPAAAAPGAPAPAPIDLDIQADGKIGFQGETLTLEALKPKLDALAKATPNQPIVIKPADKSVHKLVKKVQTLCHAAKLTATVDTSVADKAEADKLAAQKAADEKAAADKAAAKKAADDKAAADKAAAKQAALDKAAADKVAADKAAADKAAAKKAALDKAVADQAAAKKAADDKKAAAKAAVDKAVADAKLPPVELIVHADGKIEYEGATLSEDDLKPKLADLAGTSPNRPVVISHKETLAKGALRKVRDLCHAAKLTNVSLAKATPAPSADNTSAPAMLPLKMGPAPVASPSTTTATDSSAPAPKPKKAPSTPAPANDTPNNTVP